MSGVMLTGAMCLPGDVCKPGDGTYVLKERELKRQVINMLLAFKIDSPAS